MLNGHPVHLYLLCTVSCMYACMHMLHTLPPENQHCATTTMPTIAIVSCANVLCCHVAVYGGRSPLFEHDTPRVDTWRSDRQHHSDPCARHEHIKRQTKHVRHHQQAVGRVCTFVGAFCGLYIAFHNTLLLTSSQMPMSFSSVTQTQGSKR